MNYIQNLLLLAAFASTLFFSACKKEDEAPKLVLEKPTEGMVVSGEVHIHGKVIDEELHKLKITVTKDADGSELFAFSRHWHGNSEFDINQYFTPEGLTGETAVTLYVEVEDELDQITTKTVKFKVKP